MAIKEKKKAQREISRNLILYINKANFPKAVEGCWGRGLLDDVNCKVEKLIDKNLRNFFLTLGC